MLVVINPYGPVHSVDTVTGTFTYGHNSTVQIRMVEYPIIGTTAGVTVTVVGAGTINIGDTCMFSQCISIIIFYAEF